MRRHLAAGAALGCALWLSGMPSPSMAQAPAGNGNSKPAATSQAAPVASPKGRRATGASQAQFDRLVKDATAARKAEDWERAIELFTKVVKMRPDYAEGHWYLGAASYSLDKYAECRDSFRRVTRLVPENGSAYAFLGLCEFGLKEYERALTHLMQSKTLGVGDKDLGNAARYHAAILMSRIQQFPQALQTLGEFARAGNDSPRVIEAMGIATLRMPMLPDEVPPDRREMVLMAGRGSYMMATRSTGSAGKVFEALAARYPETPNIHYAYGVFLLIEQQDKAIEEFKKELQIQPNDPESLMQIAYEYLKQGQAAEALPWAKQAVEVAPNNFAAQRALGEALIETGDHVQGVQHLETAVKQAPDSPSSHFALAKAYQRVGRPADAARERAEFTRLDRLVRASRSGAQAVGGIDTERVQQGGASGSQ